jgi:hypothetical protein
MFMIVSGSGDCINNAKFEYSLSAGVAKNDIMYICKDNILELLIFVRGIQTAGTAVSCRSTAARIFLSARQIPLRK